MLGARRRLRVPPANRGAAALCYLNYGASPEVALLREQLQIGRALEGYERCVLLEATPAWVELSADDTKRAYARRLPTRTNLFNALVELAEEGFYIDLFLFAHGWREQFGAYEARANGEERISAADIESELDPRQTGLTQLPLRVVWNGSSYGETLNEAWRAVGAKATAGARYVNFFPSAWNRFMACWNRGEVPFCEAVAHAADESIRAAVQVFIADEDAPQVLAQRHRPGCPPAKTVLGEHPCAREYFLARWLADEEWQPGLSGADNMRYASRFFCLGTRQLTKQTRLTWN
jgi:hypothetical protein